VASRVEGFYTVASANGVKAFCCDLSAGGSTTPGSACMPGTEVYQVGGSTAQSRKG
jgi:hypothetical protein